MGKMLVDYDKGNYYDVIKEGDRILKEDSLTPQEEINVRTYIAFSSVAIGDTVRAVEEFNRILDIDNNFSLNPDFVSPKIISVFNSVKMARKYISPEDTITKSTAEKPQILVENEKEILFWEAFIKSAVFPGWGQISKGESSKGIILSSSFWIFTGVEGFLWYNTSRLKNDYENASTPEEAQSIYNNYTVFSQLQQNFLGICAGIWIYNVLDALLN